VKNLIPIPTEILNQIAQNKETGIGYVVVSVKLKDGRAFDQVAISAGCVIEVRGFKKLPFEGEDIASMQVTYETWNFREASDVRSKRRAAAA
jgi:hypothetical protein